jgi:Cu-Zn family superoxide dismutase
MVVRYSCHAAVAVGLLIASGTPAAVASEAKSDLKSSDGKITGTLSLHGTLSGVLLTIKLQGLSPGPHALRFHETGVCEGDYVAAGGIYNPLGAKHGLLNDEGPMAGDLPNIYAGADGVAEAELMSPFVHLGEDDEATLLDEDGTAVLVFEKPDDHQSDPDGGTGRAIACGVLRGK